MPQGGLGCLEKGVPVLLASTILPHGFWRMIGPLVWGAGSGFDSGREIEQLVEDVGLFQVVAIRVACESVDMIRSCTSTWVSIARRVEVCFGSDFDIYDNNIRRCMAAKRSRVAVASLHNPIVAVLNQKFANKVTKEECSDVESNDEGDPLCFICS